MSEKAFEDILEEIDESLENGDIDEALEKLDDHLDAWGDRPEFKVLRCELAVESEEYDEAIKLAKKAVDSIEGEEQKGRMLSARGYAHYYLDELEDARAVFNDAVKACPTLMTAIVGRAMVHEDLGYYSAAMLDLNRAIEIDELEAQPWAIRGAIHLHLGDVESAKNDLRYAVESDPDDELSRLNLARIYALEQKTSQAMETIEALCEDGWDPDYVAPALLLRSQLSLTLGSFEPGLEDAERAIELIPDLPWGYLQAAACILTSSADPGRAVALLKEAEDTVEDIRDIPDIYPLRASAYDQLGKQEKAQQWREDAEGVSRLPAFVYGSLNPAQNIPINPNKPIDIRALLDDLFGQARLAPDGYEDVLREVIQRIPEIARQNPNAEQLQIELPEAEGMVGGKRQLVVQVNSRKQA